MQRLGALTLLLAPLVAAAGCAEPNTVSTPKCARGRGKPISLIEMRSQLRANALPVAVEHALCDEDDEDDIAELVSTDRARLRCTVYSHPVYPKMREHPRSRYEGPNYSGKAFVVAFANVDCWDYGEGSTRSSTLRKLRGIFRNFGATSETVERY